MESYYETAYNKGLGPEPRFMEVANIFKTFHGHRFLDVGCGDGDFTLVLKKAMNAEEAYGVEISSQGVASALKKGIKAFECDINSSSLPFANNFFDVVYLGEIIEHVFDPDHLLDEVSRVLATGGNCVLTTPNLAGWPNRLSLLLGYQPYPTAASPHHENAGKIFLRQPQGQWGHIRVMTLKALKELVRYHALRVRMTKGSTATLKTSSATYRAITAIDRVMSRFPSLATRVILVLEKESSKR